MNIMTNSVSKEHSYISGRNIAQFKNFDVTKKDAFDGWEKVGIHFNKELAQRMAYAMDDIPSPITTPSIGTPVQFLQSWVPGFIYVITAVRKIDELVGIATVANWHMEQVVIATMENLGLPQPYGDYNNFPQSSYNTNFETRTIFRGHDGIQVNTLEEQRASEIRVDSGAQKRESSVNQLEILRNQIGFFGYNNGAGQTYGFLNDPTLPAYVTVPLGVSGFTQWSTKTYLEIVNDIQIFSSALITQSKGNIDPFKDDLTLALPLAAIQYLNTVSTFGNSVQEYINQTYKNMRVVGAPELDGANGGANAAYLYADKVSDNSTDGGRVFSQYVPTKFISLGVEKLTNGYREAYSNATAGTYLGRPWAVYRASGV
jgi:hypothetical protein